MTQFGSLAGKTKSPPAGGGAAAAPAGAAGVTGGVVSGCWRNARLRYGLWRVVSFPWVRVNSAIFQPLSEISTSYGLYSSTAAKPRGLRRAVPSGGAVALVFGSL